MLLYFIIYSYVIFRFESMIARTTRRKKWFWRMLRHCASVCVCASMCGLGAVLMGGARAHGLSGAETGEWRAPERNTVWFMHLHINHWLDRLKKLGGYCEPANNRETSTFFRRVGMLRLKLHRIFLYEPFETKLFRERMIIAAVESRIVLNRTNKIPF